jgi:3-hydroxyisobutyrate dehydrogenase-like beta-hydroxyacid dehydrogenase
MSLMAAEERVDVGFIGLGKMGIGIARNLAKAGYHVKAWNRTAAALQPADCAVRSRCPSVTGGLHDAGRRCRNS